MSKKNIYKVLFIILALLLPEISEKLTLIRPEGADLLPILVYPISFYILLSLGLNFVVGKAGLIDLGYVSFFAIGAYTYATISSKTSLNLYLAVFIAAIIASISGLIFSLPALRLRGDYLAITTLILGEIITKTIANFDYFGGQDGIGGIKNIPEIFGLKFDIMSISSYYYLLLTTIIFLYLTLERYENNKIGRQIESMKGNENLAELLGVNLLKSKSFAFAFGGFVGGLAGAIFASKSLYISPESFNLNISIILLSGILLGGINNIHGVIIGVMIISYLPEKIRFLGTYREIIFALIIILVVNLRPKGIFPRRNEIREKEKEKIKELTDEVRDMIVSEKKLKTDKDIDENKSDREDEGLKKEVVLKISNLEFGYKNEKIINKINLEVKKGECLAIIGPNGSGKSTLLNILTRDLKKFQGEVTLNKVNISKIKRDKIINLGVSKSYQHSEVFPNLSIIENLEIGVENKNSVKFKKRDEKIRDIIYKILKNNIKIDFTKNIENLSYGEIKELEIGRSVILGENLILLDEPSAGSSSKNKDNIANIINQSKKDKKTIIIIDHDMKLIEKVADRVIVIAKGEIIYEGDFASLRKNKVVLESYLGKSSKELKTIDKKLDLPKRENARKEILELKNIDYIYKEEAIFSKANLKVCEGEILSIIGNNGIGKTTLLDIINQDLKEHEGEIKWRDVKNNEIYYVNDKRNLISELTGKENLKISYLQGRKRGENFNQILEEIENEFPIISKILNREARTYSGGERQILAICKAIVFDPKVILIDEPAQGISPKIAELIYQKLEDLRKQNKTILIAELNPYLAYKVSDKVYSIKMGKIEEIKFEEYIKDFI